MKKRVIAIILVLAMLVPLAGCGGGPAVAKETVIVEGLINQDNTTLFQAGVGIHIDPVNFSEDLNVKITTVPNAPPLDDEGEISLHVYDFSVEGKTDFPGVLELSIPIEPGDDQGVGAAYLNEETGRWEPVVFRYDENEKSVTVYTDHLSKYGAFVYHKQGQRRATLQFVGLYEDGEDDEFLAAVEEFSLAGVPGSQCVDIGLGAAGDSLQIGGDILGNIVQSAGYAAYGEDIISNLGDRLGSLGLMLSIVQVGTNIYQGKIHEALVGSMKTAFTYVFGKITSKLSSSVLSASMASVAIIDYSINKFGTTAIEGRKNLYRDAYNIYYQRGEDGFKSSAFWYEKFYPMFSNPQMTQEDIKVQVDKIVVEHCNEFWNIGENINFYVSEARERFNWTGAEAGLNEDMRKSISEERRATLYNDVLPGVFNHIAHKINLENEGKLIAEYTELVNYLNSLVTVNIKDPKGIYDKHIIKFAPLNEKAEVKNWTGKLKGDTNMATSFTLYGHMYAGSPNRLDIYEPEADLEKDKPIRSVEFKVNLPSIDIILGDEIKGLKFESGEKGKVTQLGMYAALREIDVIQVEEDGSFAFDVPYATASGGEGNNKFTTEVAGFHMEGKLDPGSYTGTATFNGLFQFRRNEISPLEAMEGETKAYVTTYTFDDTVTGTVNISGEGDKVTFSTQLEAVRSGFTKLQYHSISPDGTEFWGDNPTITDKSETFNGSGSYVFTVHK